MRNWEAFGIIVTIIVIAIAGCYAVTPMENRDGLIDWNESIYADFVFWYDYPETGNMIEGKLSIILDAEGEITGDVVYNYVDTVTGEEMLHQRHNLRDYGVVAETGDDMVNSIVLEYNETMKDIAKGYMIKFYED